MSLDGSVYVFVPAPSAAAALRVLAGTLAPMPGKKPTTLKLLAPDGTKANLPITEFIVAGMDARKVHPIVEGDPIEFDALLDPDRNRDETKLFPASVELKLGQEYFEIALGCPGTSLGALLFQPSVRARVGDILDAGVGGAAISEFMGEWRTFERDEADDRLVTIPADGHRDDVEVDEFAAFVVGLRRSGS